LILYRILEKSGIQDLNPDILERIHLYLWKITFNKGIDRNIKIDRPECIETYGSSISWYFLWKYCPDQNDPEQ
jgi:hypothetical protein